MRGRASACWLLASLLVSVAANADDLWMRDDARWLVMLGAGAWDVAMPTDSKDTAPLYEIELRMKPGFWYFHPHIGLQGTTDGMVYGYGGVHLDLPIGDHLRFVPSGSVGAYYRGDNGKDLVGTMEFRIGAGLAWRFSNDWRVGVDWYHMSNAGTAHQNPGAEMMLLEVGIPLP
jgi:hypothetical protein